MANLFFTWYSHVLSRLQYPPNRSTPPSEGKQMANLYLARHRRVLFWVLYIYRITQPQSLE